MLDIWYFIVCLARFRRIHSDQAWTTLSIRDRRISELYNPTYAKVFIGNTLQIKRSRNYITVKEISDLGESDLG